jgi:hypothetical protein
VRIFANLDAEATWSGTRLAPKVAERISALSALLVALAPRADDAIEIWAPAAVDAGAIRWDAIGRAATMRVGSPATWDLAWAEPAAKAANDRRLVVAVQRELGIAHARVITDVQELDALTGAWVAKAPWTAAGRDRIHGTGAPRDDQRTYATRLLAQHGALVVEPWLERRFDVGVCASIDVAGRVTAQPPHTLLCDARGAFVGIDLAAPPLTSDEHAHLDRAVAASGAALARIGYAGPFTVDGFAHTRGFHAPCEINARYSFGHVARALGAQRLGFGPPPPGVTVLIDGLVTAWRA